MGGFKPMLGGIVLLLLDAVSAPASSGVALRQTTRPGWGVLSPEGERGVQRA